MSSPEDQAALRPHLLPGERVAWSGRPTRSIPFDRRDLVAAVSGAAWTLMYFWILPRPGQDQGSGLNLLIDAAIILIGVLIALGRFVHGWWLRRRLLYAVTDRRAIILRGGAKGRLRSHDLAWLPMLELEQQGGSGTLFMEPGEQPDTWYERATAHESGLSRGFCFVDIDQPERVYDIICREGTRRRAELALEETPAFTPLV
ncbi:MAG: hypothetical protein ACK4K7_09650 [Allosphingosinicella sp.]|uniref:hypothetical protein n=1 Tax=Allosphingosinicella sp. TaxID=2823234 RepID=UPI003958AC15